MWRYTCIACLVKFLTVCLLPRLQLICSISNAFLLHSGERKWSLITRNFISVYVELLFLCPFVSHVNFLRENKAVDVTICVCGCEVYFPIFSRLICFNEILHGRFVTEVHPHNFLQSYDRRTNFWGGTDTSGIAFWVLNIVCVQGCVKKFRDWTYRLECI